MKDSQSTSERILYQDESKAVLKVLTDKLGFAIPRLRQYKNCLSWDSFKKCRSIKPLIENSNGQNTSLHESHATSETYLAVDPWIDELTHINKVKTNQEITITWFLQEI